MVLKPEAIIERLKELDQILGELAKYQKGLSIFPRFSQEIVNWMDALEQ